MYLTRYGILQLLFSFSDILYTATSFTLFNKVETVLYSLLLLALQEETLISYHMVSKILTSFSVPIFLIPIH
jgi:hypothetical protein